MDTKIEDTKQTSNELYKLLCPVDLFRYFIRKQYEGIDISNDDINELRTEFAKYLKDLNLTDKQKANILPKDTFDIILNDKHPFRMHGFSPAYVYHFGTFINMVKKRGISK